SSRRTQACRPGAAPPRPRPARRSRRPRGSCSPRPAGPAAGRRRGTRFRWPPGRARGLRRASACSSSSAGSVTRIRGYTAPGEYSGASRDPGPAPRHQPCALPWGACMDIAELLAFSVKNKASDLHLSAGLPPMIRVDGDVRRINIPALDHKQVHALVYDIMSDKQRRDYEEFLEVDFSFEIAGLARFRVNAFNQNRGAGAVFRTIPSE